MMQSVFFVFKRKIAVKILVVFLVLLSLLGCANRAVVKDKHVTVIPSENVSEEVKPVRLDVFTPGPMDVLEIDVWGRPELQKKVQIDPSGKIAYPFVGEILVAGKTTSQLSELITLALSDYYQNPKVTVSLISINSMKIYVLGEVKKPGVFLMQGPMGVVEALSLAGGLSEDANTENVILIRGDKETPTLIELDVNRALTSAALVQNLDLKSSDILYVPKTTIADFSKFMTYFYSILRPFLALEQISFNQRRLDLLDE